MLLARSLFSLVVWSFWGSFVHVPMGTCRVPGAWARVLVCMCLCSRVCIARGRMTTQGPALALDIHRHVCRGLHDTVGTPFLFLSAQPTVRALASSKCHGGSSSLAYTRSTFSKNNFSEVALLQGCCASCYLHDWIKIRPLLSLYAKQPVLCPYHIIACGVFDPFPARVTDWGFF